MNPKKLLLARLKRMLSDKNALWIALSITLVILSVVLFFVSKPWVLKVLFLVIAIGAAVYCWLLFESRRISPKPSQRGSASPLSSETSAVETRSEMHDNKEQTETTETEGTAAELTPPVEPEKHPVFVSEKGDKYHLDRKCFGLRFADNVKAMSKEEAVSLNRKPCSKCQAKAGE